MGGSGGLQWLLREGPPIPCLLEGTEAQPPDSSLALGHQCGWEPWLEVPSGSGGMGASPSSSVGVGVGGGQWAEQAFEATELPVPSSLCCLATVSWKTAAGTRYGPSASVAEPLVPGGPAGGGRPGGSTPSGSQGPGPREDHMPSVQMWGERVCVGPPEAWVAAAVPGREAGGARSHSCSGTCWVSVSTCQAFCVVVLTCPTPLGTHGQAQLAAPCHPPLPPRKGQAPRSSEGL